MDIDRDSLTNKVKFCRECDRNVTVKKDGTCIHGHMPRSLSSPVPITGCPKCGHPYKWKTDTRCSSCGSDVPRMTTAAGIGFRVGMAVGRRKSVYR